MSSLSKAGVSSPCLDAISSQFSLLYNWLQSLIDKLAKNTNITIWNFLLLLRSQFRFPKTGFSLSIQHYINSPTNVSHTKFSNVLQPAFTPLKQGYWFINPALSPYAVASLQGSCTYSWLYFLSLVCTAMDSETAITWWCGVCHLCRHYVWEDKLTAKCVCECVCESVCVCVCVCVCVYEPPLPASYR